MHVLLIPSYACWIYAVRASAARGQLQSPISTLLLFILQMRVYTLFDYSGFNGCASDGTGVSSDKVAFSSATSSSVWPPPQLAANCSSVVPTQVYHLMRAEYMGCVRALCVVNRIHQSPPPLLFNPADACVYFVSIY